MTELKPCPFCGGEGSIYKPPTADMNAIYIGQCINCDVNTSVFNTESKAIEAWNTRADTQPALDTIEQIDSAIDAKFAEIEKLVELKWQIKSNEEAGE